MNKNIGFAFDLHGTLVQSNEAWIQAYEIAVGDNDIKDAVSKMIYGKVSRKKIAQLFNVNYEHVLKLYHKFVTPEKNMCKLVCELASYFPVFLISSASQEKVELDLKKIGMSEKFTFIYHKDNFSKFSKQDWDRLISTHELDLLYYVGNDIKEDFVNHDNVCVLLSGTFFYELNKLGMLFNRENEVKSNYD